MDKQTRDALAILNRAMDRQPDADIPGEAYVWLTDAANHLRGYKLHRPELRASVQWPEPRN